MRYTIGYSDYKKETGESFDGGIYASTSYGLPYILTTDNFEPQDKNSVTIYVSDDLEEIKKAISILSVSYRRDDVWLKPHLKSKKIRRFYPLKIDSSKFAFTIDNKPAYKKPSTLKTKELDFTATLENYKITGMKKA